MEAERWKGRHADDFLTADVGEEAAEVGAENLSGFKSKSSRLSEEALAVLPVPVATPLSASELFGWPLLSGRRLDD